jgi:hypothetical protein
MPSFTSEHNGWVSTQLTSGSAMSGSSASWTSAPIDILNYKYYGIAYCTPGTTPQLQIDALCAISVADGMPSPASQEYVIPESASAIVSSTSGSAWHVTSIQPPPCSHMKIRFSGVAGNESDTTLCCRFFAKL